MTKKEKQLLSLDVVYLSVASAFLISYLYAGDINDLLFLILITSFYLRIKIYRWKKYH